MRRATRTLAVAAAAAILTAVATLPADAYQARVRHTDDICSITKALTLASQNNGGGTRTVVPLAKAAPLIGTKDFNSGYLPAGIQQWINFHSSGGEKRVYGPYSKPSWVNYDRAWTTRTFDVMLINPGCLG